MISFSASSHAEKLRSHAITVSSHTCISANAAAGTDNESVGSSKCPASLLKLTHPSPGTRDKATQRTISVAATFGKPCSLPNDSVASVTSIYNSAFQVEP